MDRQQIASETEIEPTKIPEAAIDMTVQQTEKDSGDQESLHSLNGTIVNEDETSESLENGIDDSESIFAD